MNEEEERKRFEAWIKTEEYQTFDRYPDKPGYSFAGEYKKAAVQLAWMAWQEAIRGER